MSESNGFFRWIWRVNAILFLLLCLGAAAGSGWWLWQNHTSHAQVDGAVGLDGHYKPPAEHRFHYFGLDRGSLVSTSGHRAVLLKRWDHRMSDAPFAAPVPPLDSDVNLLEINNASGEARWVFPGHAQSILLSAVIRETGSEQSSPIALALYVKAVTYDAQGELNSPYDPDPKYSLVVYRPGAKDLKKLPIADNITWMAQTSTDRFLVLSGTGGTRTATLFSLPDFEVVSAKPLEGYPG